MSETSVIRNPLQRKPRLQRRGAPARSACEAYARANHECAAIVLSDLERYGGPGSLMALWAEAVVHGQERQEREWRLTA
jgi:hypothetical protein